MPQIRALEFYSGIGGLHRALNRTGISASVVRAFDWDQNACRVYHENYGAGIVEKVDISTISPLDLSLLDAQLWLLSPSCQPYTVLNPAAKGEADPRAASFLHIIKNILPVLHATGQAPKWMLIENVAGFETSSTRTTLVDILDECDYEVMELLLSPRQFGIPNSRRRYYLLAKAKPLCFAHVPNSRDDPRVRCTWDHIPLPMHYDLGSTLGKPTEEVRLYLDDLLSSEYSQFAVPDRILQKWGRLFDIVLPTSRGTCCFTRGYTQLVERSGSILQENESLDTTEVFNKFLASKSDKKSSESDALSILTPLRLRYFTPTELLRLFHFIPPQKSTHTAPHWHEVAEETTLRSQRSDQIFIWPPSVSTKNKYRLIGNSVNVEVVQRLIAYLFEGDGIREV